MVRWQRRADWLGVHRHHIGDLRIRGAHESGTVHSWGLDAAGGSGAPSGTGFTAIFSTADAFAALHESGTVHVWGSGYLGGIGAPSGSDFVSIFSTARAFVAISENGGIHGFNKSSVSYYSYGDSDFHEDWDDLVDPPTGPGYTIASPASGRWRPARARCCRWCGRITPYPPGRPGYRCGQYVRPTSFVALGADGSIHTWGRETEVPSGTGFIAIFSNLEAYAALDKSGAIHVWGTSSSGGSHTSGTYYSTSWTGAPNGTGFTAIYSTHSAFAALHQSGSIRAWGNSNTGGSGAPSGTGFTAIFSTDSAFAALDKRGGIHTWGNNASGGGDYYGGDPLRCNYYWCGRSGPQWHRLYHYRLVS